MQGSDDTERTALIHGNATADFDPAASFQRRLDSELHKIDSFYTETEDKLYHDLDKLIDDHQSYLDEVSVQEFASQVQQNANTLSNPTLNNNNNNNSPGAFPGSLSNISSAINTNPNIGRRYTTAEMFSSSNRSASNMFPNSIRSSNNLIDSATADRSSAKSSDSDEEEIVHRHNSITSPRMVGLSPALRPQTPQRIPSSSLLPLHSPPPVGGSGSGPNSIPHSYAASIEGSRPPSPVRLFRHSRTHSIDDSELPGRGTGSVRGRAQSEFVPSSGSHRRSRSVSSLHRRSSSVGGLFGAQSLLDETFIALRMRTTNLYVSLSELRSFIQLNRTGFSKALKKFDKTLNTTLRSRYMEQVLTKAYCFSSGTEDHLTNRIEEVVSIYASLVTDNNEPAAVEQLHAYLRERVVFDRNTVWRDQMEMGRIAHATPVVKDVKLQGEEDTEKVTYYSCFGYSIPDYVLSPSAIKLSIITLIFFFFLSTKFLESEPQNRCLAVVVTASLLWATEAMPLFVTSLLIPFLVICLRIPCDANGVPLEATVASQFIFSQMWSSVIMLLLGGFTLAAALSKYNIAKMLATAILSRAGTNPKVVLLTLMFVSTFLSMWISNVAAPVLCFSIAQPLLRTLPTGSQFAKGIILGIALASNVGGMASPIASPQNIIALENMNPPPTWGQWFAVSIPVCILANILIWALLIITFKPGKDVKVTAPIRVVNETFGFTQWFISIVTVATIILWCISHQLEPYVGEMGVLALVPIVIFFGSKILTSDDFNNFLWTIIALAMGGVALGKAVSTSGLLATVAHGIEEHVIKGYGVFGVMAIFGFMILIVATFVSHTVAALIILPLIQSIGSRMEDAHPRLLVMGAAFLCSAAMGLPTSGFPNVTAICMVDEFGRPYLTVGNFISRGVPASVLAYLVIISIGYIIMRFMGF